MPCVYISTNLCLDGLDLDPVFADATKAVAAIIGRPENFVMVILKGSLAISFGGNKEPAAYTEIVAMGGINTQVKRKLIATLGTSSTRGSRFRPPGSSSRSTTPPRKPSRNCNLNI
ncbi:uncharacterized protein J3R85_016221 [Psidium guajava]|nr:uncharacterized protein J3R85_016221 [Psidium guajava]